MWRLGIKYSFFWLLILPLICAGCGGEKAKKKQLSPAAQMAQSEKIADPAERSKALTAAALSYLKAADSTGARSALLQSNRAAEEIKKREPTQRVAAYILLSAAWYQVEGTNRDNCKDAYRAAERAVRDIDSPVEKTEALLDLAALKDDIDRKADAKKHLAAGTEGIDGIDDPVERVRLLGKITRFYVKVGDDSAAKQTIQSAQQWAEKDQNKATQAKLLVLIAREKMEVLKDSAGGETDLETAQKIAAELSSKPNQQANLLIDVAQVFVDTGKKTQARKLLDEAEKIARGKSECKPAMNRIEKTREQL